MNMENLFPLKIQLFSILISVLLFLFVGRLIIKKKIREEYGFLWLVACFFILVFSIWREGLDGLAQLLGVYYAPSLFFLMALFLLVGVSIHHSVVISELQKKIRTLTQEKALKETEERESEK